MPPHLSAFDPATSLDRRQATAIVIAMLPPLSIWMLNGLYLPWLAKQSTLLFWLADVAQWVLLPLVLLVMLAVSSGIKPGHYGLQRISLQRENPVAETLLVAACTGLVFFLVRNVAWLLLHYPATYFVFGKVLPEGFKPLFVLYAALTAGFVESIFFIGLPWLLYAKVKNRGTPLTVAAFVSLFFALSHWEQGSHVVVAAFASNLVAWLCFLKLRSLWPVAGGHALVDIVAFW